MSNEYVLASDVVSVLKKMHEEGYCIGNNEAMQRVFEELANLKMVEAEPVVHAHWEDVYGGKYANPRYRCSACKAKAQYKLEQNLLLSWKEVQALTPRCSNCGAHMDEDLELRTCYCPLCDKHFEVRSNDSMGDCPDCGHHVVLRIVEVSNE